MEIEVVKYVRKEFEEVVKIAEKLEGRKTIPLKIRVGGKKISGRALLLKSEKRSIPEKFGGKLIEIIENEYLFFERDGFNTVVYKLKLQLR